MQLTWTFPPPAGQPFNSWDRFYEKDEQARIMGLCAHAAVAQESKKSNTFCTAGGSFWPMTTSFEKLTYS